MGMRKMSVSAYEKPFVPAVGNPDPKNFQVLLRETAGGQTSLRYTALLLLYPDCTNYEGKKIVVVEGPFQDWKTLDPHFSDRAPIGSRIVARFQPTSDGWRDALNYIAWKSNS